MISAAVIILVPVAYAEKQVPGIVVAVQGDPYYFAEGGFGISILKYYGIPLTPYLTPETTENSSLTDILNSFYSAEAKAGVHAIVDNQDRAKYYVVHFWSTSNGSQTFTTFSKFQPIITHNTLTPPGFQQYNTGFSLESLPGKDKKWFYDTLIDTYIKPGAPQPFNVDVDIVTGDGSILQTFQYVDCKVTGYVPFLSENLLLLHFTKKFRSEIRDRTDFNCDGFKVNFDLRKPSSDWSSVKNTIDLIPDKNDTIQKYVVTFSSSIFGKGQTFQTFPKFIPTGAQDNIPLSNPINIIPENHKSFSLESLPSKDKQLFYQYVTNELSPKGGPNRGPVDISIDLVTGKGTTLQNWKYPRCDVTNYSIYREENDTDFKFKQSDGAEIRDKTFFSCNGLQVDFMPKKTTQSQTTAGQTIPSDNDRAQVFRIHFTGGSVEKSFDYTFLKFAPFSTSSGLDVPDYSFGEKPQFYVESLSSKDMVEFYKLTSKYVNTGNLPQPFDATVDVVSGDNSTLQTWKYTKCDITNYVPYWASNLEANMLSEKYQAEVRVRMIFQCDGLSFEGPKVTNPNSVSLIRPINFVSNYNDSTQLFDLKFSNGEIPIMHQFHTFVEFLPDFVESDHPTTSYPKIESTGFALTSLPSKDKAEYYKFLSRYINPTSSKPEPFDASIDFVTGDTSIIQTWKYQKCHVTDYKNHLHNNLLSYTMTSKKGISEIQEYSHFQCSGFSITFGGGHENVTAKQTTPSDDDRSMAFVIHLTSNVYSSVQTIGLVQQFDIYENQLIHLETLPNKYDSIGSFLVSKYINPGEVPLLFDETADYITGDGTKLFSLKYGKCFVSNYMTYLNDNMGIIKFGSPIKPEIRVQSDDQCSGLSATILPPDNPTDIINIIIQKAIRISDDKLACNKGFQLMVKPPNNNVACIKVNSVSKLIQLGWKNATSSYHNLSNNLTPLIPTDDERAVSYRVSFQGEDIPTQTRDTFSNFIPTSINSNTNPSGSFSKGSATFQLESLPSKDKADLYHLVSKYVNPGTKPELFDVTVDVVSGDNSTLQTWKYADCQVSNYNIYLDENGLLYKFHRGWENEIKDVTEFSCNGLNLGFLK